MNSPYLLIAGANYYPEQGTGNWIDRFETHVEALNQIDEDRKECNTYFMKGPHKGEVKEYRTDVKYIIDNRKYDWYEIVNLETWKL